MHWQDEYEHRNREGGVNTLALTTLALVKAAAAQAIETDARQVELEQSDTDYRISVKIKR